MSTWAFMTGRDLFTKESDECEGVKLDHDGYGCPEVTVHSVAEWTCKDLEALFFNQLMGSKF